MTPFNYFLEYGQNFASGLKDCSGSQGRPGKELPAAPSRIFITPKDAPRVCYHPSNRLSRGSSFPAGGDDSRAMNVRMGF